MQCPKCTAEMSTVIHEGIEVDRCLDCRGLFLDSTELERLLEIGGSEVIDVGDKARGKRLNRIDRIDCPRCVVPMLRLVDHEQPHVWYEQCPSCQGTFLDAGELTDLAHFTLLDWFRDLFSKARQ